MGVESFDNVPTRESLEARLAEVRQMKERNMDKLQEAKDIPISAIFREGDKHQAISDWEQNLKHNNAEIEEIEKKIAELDSK